MCVNNEGFRKNTEINQISESSYMKEKKTFLQVLVKTFATQRFENMTSYADCLHYLSDKKSLLFMPQQVRKASDIFVL